ncbi:conserved hypothetical protein [Rhodoferax ferrireducens T118]|uniref:DUF3443 domain-containing protein n=1 Tax=Albidiferax ferrireducens (strain ATCC BAA-621 / DSM 15236 / T118) TaxID=338969 RepID=Q21UN4_ALBFT|nr:conserved hypothetical protein [Rhodoferax ferrireducens T118]
MYCNKFLNRVLALALVATLVTACGGGGGGSTPAPSAPAVPTAPEVPSAPVVPTVPEAANVSKVTVDAGPSGTGYNVNRLYTTVTVCSPGSTTQCQTIDHVLVDTGSFGVRLLSSAMDTTLNLKRSTGASGLPLLNCAQFVDLSFAWGPVVKADVVLGGKTAASVPIQVIADPSFNSLAAVCSSGTAITNATILGANGILGIGLFKEDCGARCNNIVNNGSYYTCTTASCTGAKASLAQQVKNPVPLFASDNNGVLIDLPGASSAGAPNLSGSLIFGIGTQSNNQWTSGAVLTTDAVGYVTTLLAGQNLPNNFTNSFIDSGSNGLFFDSTTITKCGPSGAGFYCPTPPVNLSATLLGANGVITPEILFSIDKATDLFTGGVNHVLPTLAGDIGDIPGHPSTFDWGLPFFYGRRVFFGIEGQASTLGTGPFYAF